MQQQRPAGLFGACCSAWQGVAGKKNSSAQLQWLRQPAEVGVWGRNPLTVVASRLTVHRLLCYAVSCVRALAYVVVQCAALLVPVFEREL